MFLWKVSVEFQNLAPEFAHSVFDIYNLSVLNAIVVAVEQAWKIGEVSPPFNK